MRALAIVIISLLFLECFYYVEPAPTRQSHARRPRCEKPCKEPSDCKRPCIRCNNHPWGDTLCKTK
uniref:Putative secreted salivary protein n=1 Tax=Ixodes scapularis TaxID=6945 RepID=Q4PMP8_IXOSC|nr:putative secreted salivary protein [Ixodes scapularis]